MLLLLAGEKDILGCLFKDTAEACNFDATVGQGCLKSVQAEENEDATTRAMAVPGSRPARTNAGQCGDRSRLRGEDDAESAQPVHRLYLVGAYHYHVAHTSGEGGKPLVCFPTPAPSRNEGIRMFIAWAQAHPQYMNEPPVETEFRFLTEKWPCQK
jgi:hypothetical protein